MEISQIIAENLKILRTERNLSLGQLSTLCGVSKVMLSQIEKGETNPTINMLWKVSEGLKVPYSALLEQRAREVSTVCKGDILLQEDDEAHYRIFCFFPSTPSRNFELYQIELDGGHRHITTAHREKTHEYIMVLEGLLRLTIGEETFILKPDDAMHFYAAVEHGYSAEGMDMVKAIVINYYPT